MPRGTGHSADDRLSNELGAVMRNDNVDSAFRGILAGVSPQVPDAVKPMVAADDASRKLLEDAADILCKDDAQRALLQNVYLIGKQDGQIDALKTAIGRITT